VRRFLSTDGRRITTRLTQILDQKVLTEFARQGKLQDVILINRGRSPASRKVMQQTTVGGSVLGGDNSQDKLEVRIHKEGGFSPAVLTRLFNAVRQGINPRPLVQVPGMKDMDDLLVDIERQGRKQRFSLLNPDDSPMRYDITDQVVMGKDHYPTWTSLHEAADMVWQDLNPLLI